jgi:DNA (cytosine-5)-methyltransferase 1
MYVVFWKKGNKAPMLDYMPAAHCPKCEKDVQAVQTWKNPDKKFGKYRQQYVYCCPAHGIVVEPYYYASFNCIDWSDPGKRIGDREKPLSLNTEKRIRYGLDRYGREPYIIHAAYSDQALGVVRQISSPAFTQTTFTTQAIVQPFIIDDKHTTGISYRVKGLNDIIPTVHTDPRLRLVMPFIIKEEHSKNKQNARSTAEAFQTQTTRQSMAVISTPFLTEMYGGSGAARSITDEINTVTAGGVKTGIVTSEAFQSFLTSYYNGSHCLQHITEASGTMTTKERIGIVNYKTPAIEDCYYRMLKPKEIKLAMAFDGDYVVLGSGKDQVKQLGNAVTPPAMEWLVQQVIDSLK